MLTLRFVSLTPLFTLATNSFPTPSLPLVIWVTTPLQRKIQCDCTR